jgi:phosphatidylserine/phosphatidylglycerophosphate/cardiolipin synthase-like enzyme
VAELHRVDRYGRFRAYAPHTRGGKVVIVHSKLALIDDRLLRIGSTNLNNRSFGYDTECDLAIEAEALVSGRGKRSDALQPI